MCSLCKLLGGWYSAVKPIQYVLSYVYCVIYRIRIAYGSVIFPLKSFHDKICKRCPKFSRPGKNPWNPWKFSPSKILGYIITILLQYINLSIFKLLKSTDLVVPIHAPREDSGACGSPYSGPHVCSCIPVLVLVISNAIILWTC